MRNFAFLVPVFIQILLPSYYGNQITLESEDLSNSLFNLLQNSQTTKFKSSMIIFMENLKKSIKVQSAVIFTIDLENFLKIINAGYSLFAILKNLREP